MTKQAIITSVEIYKADIPYPEPFKIAIGEMTAANNVAIKINTDDGTYGIGEASPVPYIAGETQNIMFAAATDLAKVILNKDALDIEGRMTEINRFLANNSTIRSGFDMALYDLAAKVAGMPLYAYLGGSKRSLVTDLTIGIDTPEIMVKKALEIKAKGFPAIKVKLGTTMEEDIERIQAIRDAIGEGMPIRIDANQGWDYYTAVGVLRGIAHLGIQYCEQPVAIWDYENTKRVRENSTIPIMADECLFDHHDAFKLASMGAVDYFNIKLAKSGGIHSALKINGIAEGAGIPCMIGCMSETRLGISAAAHLMCAKPNIRYGDLDGHTFHASDPIKGGITLSEGDVEMPEGLGIGADYDSEFLKACESIIIS